jgi:hypothetical protein
MAPLCSACLCPCSGGNSNRFDYIYDFGDHWRHTIKIVKPMPAVPGIDYPLLIDAVGRCPLDDSGGPPGYMEMLEALRDPAHPRHAEVIEWPGPDFDPNDANRAKLETDVAALAKLMTPRRRASAKPKQKRRSGRTTSCFDRLNGIRRPCRPSPEAEATCCEHTRHLPCHGANTSEI